MISQREDAFLGAWTDLAASMGTPDLSLWIPGAPVSRPSGKPYRSNPTRRIMATPKAQAKEDAKISKAKRWQQLLAYREKIQLLVRAAWKTEPISSPCLTLVEFIFDPPVSREKRDRGRYMKSTKPDIKNLTFALEDALNPHCVRDKKKKVVAGFPGLWCDDSLSHTLGIRSYRNAGHLGEGVWLRVWIL